MALSKNENVLSALRSEGIITPLDVLEHLPYRFESFLYTPSKNGDYEDKERIVILGKLRGAKPTTLRFSSRSVSRFYFETTEGETFLVEAWNRPYLSKIVVPDVLYTISGSFDARRHSLSLLNLVKGEVSKEEALRPVYRLPSSIESMTFRKIVRKCLMEEAHKVKDVIPASLKERYRLPSREEAFWFAHFPKSKEELRQAMRLFKYEEALSFELRSQLVRFENKKAKTTHREPIPMDKFNDFVSKLPYSLTSDQRKALDDALADMDDESLMYRLLQGDTGSGKTLVASLLCYASYLRGEQSAFMAPTDALARQHYANLKALFEGTKVQVVLLLGAMSGVEKRLALNDAADGTGDIFVGTQSLFSKSVHYSSLGLVIIDEQHKFGVNQRTLLLDKGEHTDLLMMSATPIPRTLTMTIYGDLDISTLNSFPFGKRKVKVKMAKSAQEIHKAIEKTINEKKRCYVVVPEIEPKEGERNISVKEVFASYKAIFKDDVALLHGAMDEESKRVAMTAFKSGLCPILVATSLIEVGVDVKEANLMIIYHPSHFSLSSLHQLRGRIGRDGSEGTCYLIPEKGLSDEGKKKLEVLISEDDGFRIAEEDLKLRGPGEVGGTRQSGLPEFNYANIIDDFRVFEAAREDAKAILFLKGKEFETVLPLLKGRERIRS